MSALKDRTACLPLVSSFIASLLLTALAGFCAAQNFSELDLATGKALFEKNWVSAPASAQSSDGLGPYYDARSCAECHPAAGVGVMPDSLTQVIDDAVLGKQLQRHAVAGVGKETGSLQHQGSRRLPPALAGVYLFEQVSAAALQALADPTDRNNDGVSGRVAARYGRKADVSALAVQIGKAFSYDMGLSTRFYLSPWGDCTEAQLSCRQLPAGAAAGEPEVSNTVLDLIAAWLASIPAPATLREADPTFTDLGCSACHVHVLPTATGELQAWTDLLLHDLGPQLAADLPMPTDPTAASPSEWRTAPLWALRLRTHYLHDGRANSLEQAIEWHGGEAERSKLAWHQATKIQRERLLAFLQRL